MKTTTQAPKAACKTCAKPTVQECSHIDCTNRRPVTAAPRGCGNPILIPSCGMTVPRRDYYGERS